MGCGSSSSAEGQQEQQQQASSQQEPAQAKVEAPKQQDTKATPTKTTPSKASSYDDNFVQESLKTHNELRGKHGVGPLTHAPDLTEYAQKWANHLVELDTMKHSDCKHQGGSIGENIYYSWASNGARADGKGATTSWYDEIKDYDFETGAFAMNTGHFTQVVWEDTKELGMAYAFSADKNTVYVVANYRPPGNYQGQFQEKVKPLK